MRRFAIIDMGTNTFHLLIAGWRDEDSYVPIYRERIYVRLGEDGLQTLSPRKIKQAVDAIERFASVIGLFEVHEVRALATEGFRRASNGEILLQRLRRGYELPIDLISGEQEAYYIYNGVRSTGLLSEEAHLMMDIGGGSVEFILGDQHTATDIMSLPIGLATLQSFVQMEIDGEASWMEKLTAHLHEVLTPLRDLIEEVPVGPLVGCSGTFDVIGYAIGSRMTGTKASSVHRDQWDTYCDRILAMNHEERRADPSIPPNRADLAGAAFCLVREVVHMLPHETFFISPFAMKEGALAEMMSSYADSLTA